MQHLCFVLDINQSLIPVYHPQANPVERKNRDLKPRLAMMVNNNHTLWIEKLPAIRFALNTSKCESTDHTAAYLTFARELRTLDQVNTNLRSVIHNDNFVPELTPYLKRFEGYMSQIKENIEMSQDRQKTYADKSRRPSPNYKVNDLFGLAIHQNDHQARHKIVEWAQNEIAVVPDFHKRILFSDEAHFWLNGYVNKQSCRIWSEANPQVYVEIPLHPEKLTVWCALWAGGILLQKR
ncbi:retrovirus-related Pol polyprotein from transposon 412 [Trichonephila clavipes]|nr:retrovirus-related Pol polyprotein from transposon 412 [Trichonephila clavipes]